MSRFLVIGGVHLDVVGAYDGRVAHLIDKPGQHITYSLGGAAFNVATNLVQNKEDVTFITALQDRSLTAFLIRSALRRLGIRTRLYAVVGGSESGYISHWKDGNLETAVSCSI